MSEKIGVWRRALPASFALSLFGLVAYGALDSPDEKVPIDCGANPHGSVANVFDARRDADFYIGDAARHIDGHSVNDGYRVTSRGTGRIAVLAAGMQGHAKSVEDLERHPYKETYPITGSTIGMALVAAPGVPVPGRQLQDPYVKVVFTC